jgi:hypothetical protein
MKSASRSIPTILAATAALSVFGTALAETRDAQGQAAALLSRVHSPESFQVGGGERKASASAATDAHAAAAALLSGQDSVGDQTVAVVIVAATAAQKPVDAHAHAAALLQRPTAPSGAKTLETASSDSSGEHPAVLVAKRWSKLGIDINSFIVAHPARLQLVQMSATQDD